MQQLLAFLPLLLCPLSMGLMVWLMREQHDGSEQRSATHGALPHMGAASERGKQRSIGTGMAGIVPAMFARIWAILRCCFDWRVLALVAALGVGMWLFAPAMAWSVLPLLLVAICLLSMLLMLWRSRRTYSPTPLSVAHVQKQPLTSTLQGDYESIT